MRFHPSFVEKLIQTCINQGGYSEESRLTRAIADMRTTIYAQQNGPLVLVDSEKMLQERIMRQQPTHDVIPIRFHSGVMNKLLEQFRSFSGHVSEHKLRQAFSSLDFTPYQTVTTGETILVLTTDYFEKLQKG